MSRDDRIHSSIKSTLQLQGFCDVRCVDAFAAFEVRDRARHAQRAVVRTRGDAEPGLTLPEQPLARRVEPAVHAQVLNGKPRVERARACELALARGPHLPGDFRRGWAWR